MADRAQVSSVEAISSFRADLIVYLSKARAVLEEIADEKQSTKAWLEHDRRAHWEREFRRRSRALEEAQQELFSAKLSRLRAETVAQTLAVERAKRQLEQAQEKRDVIRKWMREFDNRADPLVKQLDQLHTFLSNDLTKAVVYLGQVVRVLEAYVVAGRETGSAAAPLPALPESESANERERELSNPPDSKSISEP